MFSKVLEGLNWEEEKDKIYSKTSIDVENALGKDKRSIDDFRALISPAGSKYINDMANLSNILTKNRFGNIMQLYLPLYLSNECTNHCIYCGFSHDNQITRLTLNEEQILKEIEVIKSFGYEHILIVTGEHKTKAGFEYLKSAIKLIKPFFSLISLEVQPLEQSEYEELIGFGLNTVYIYQETYNKTNYCLYHPKGKKSDFEYRLMCPDRLGKAGIHRIGLGCLIGLEDWRTDSLFTAMHLKYLQKTYWKTKYSISFPRLRPHAGGFQPPYHMSDAELVQLIAAYRILDQELELSISVRESKKFRDNIIKLGITSMSAGSKTEPGGYALNTKALEQFSVHDNRSPAEIEQMLRNNGYEPVWKDWDSFMQI